MKPAFALAHHTHAHAYANALAWSLSHAYTCTRTHTHTHALLAHTGICRIRMDSCEQQLSEAYMRATCVVLPDEEEIQFLLPTGTGQVCVDRQSVVGKLIFHYSVFPLSKCWHGPGVCR
jgi:hypothetical protein